MDLKTYFQITKPRERREFADKLAVSERYLYLCTRGVRQPSSDLCKEIVKLDGRFTLAELRPDIWGNGIDAAAASDDTQPPVGSVDSTSKRKRSGRGGKKIKEAKAR